jgi:hypothetical protein
MIDIIAVTYGQNEILKCFINSIKAQTSNFIFDQNKKNLNAKNRIACYNSIANCL